MNKEDEAVYGVIEASERPITLVDIIDELPWCAYAIRDSVEKLCAFGRISCLNGRYTTEPSVPRLLDRFSLKAILESLGEECIARANKFRGVHDSGGGDLGRKWQNAATLLNYSALRYTTREVSK